MLDAEAVASDEGEEGEGEGHEGGEGEHSEGEEEEEEAKEAAKEDNEQKALAILATVLIVFGIVFEHGFITPMRELAEEEGNAAPLVECLLGEFTVMGGIGLVSFLMARAAALWPCPPALLPPQCLSCPETSA